MKDKDVYCEILDYCRSNPNFTINEIKERFPDYAEAILNEFNYNSKDFVANSGNSDGGRKYVLSFEGNSKLIQIKRIEQNRKSSKLATYIAIGSIILNISLIVVFSLKPTKMEIINDELNIKNEFKDDVIMVINELKEVNNRLDSLVLINREITKKLENTTKTKKESKQ